MILRDKRSGDSVAVTVAYILLPDDRRQSFIESLGWTEAELFTQEQFDATTQGQEEKLFNEAWREVVMEEQAEKTARSVSRRQEIDNKVLARISQLRAEKDDSAERAEQEKEEQTDRDIDARS